MEEHYVLRVPPALAERLDRVLNEHPDSAGDSEIDLSFGDDGRSGSFTIGGETFPASLLDLPCVVESWKTYDDSNLVKSADIGQMIVVREPGDPVPEDTVSRDGLTPPMRDARRRRFRRESELNPEIVAEVEKDIRSIMAGGTAKGVDVELVEAVEEDEDGEAGQGADVGEAPRGAAALNDAFRWADEKPTHTAGRAGAGTARDAPEKKKRVNKKKDGAVVGESPLGAKKRGRPRKEVVEGEPEKRVMKKGRGRPRKEDAKD